ncbi:MAG: cupin domain-containing protein [Chloroflexota bacterium]|nr:cupin domain-containing protein [Chloroflexota bacterium]
MRRTTSRVVLLFCMIVFSLGLVPTLSSAQSATPVPVLSGLGYPPEFCSPAEIDAALNGVAEWPVGGALVSPASAPGMDLYVVKVTLEPGTCVSYAGHFLHDGAAIWLVESGKVEFDFQLILGRPVPDLALGDSNGDSEPVAAFMQLEPGDWVTADRAVHYSYRNMGQEPAVIIMTVLENRWVYSGAEFSPISSGARDCNGACRNSRR